MLLAHKTFVFLLVLFFADIATAARVVLNSHQKKTFAELDERVLRVQTSTNSLTASDDCVPVLVGSRESVNIFYSYCSEKAKLKEREPVRIFNNYDVSPFLAARFNFWKRIYSLWSSDQYVLHVGDYPEVILEIADVSQRQDLSSAERDKLAKKTMKEHRRQFEQLLLSLHRLQSKPQTMLSPAQVFVAEKFSHIQDPKKFLKASASIRLQRGQRDFIESGLAVSSRYMSAIEREFEQQGIPTKLANLAFIESSFNINAYSKVGAAGIYQIMPETGRQYMMVNDLIDERRDPIKSARAAAKLLRLYHGILGSWPLAITAYNHGVGGIKTAIRSTGSSDLETLIRNYEGKAFGFASKNFYTGFLGLLWTLEQKEVVFPNVKAQAELKFENIKLKKAMNLSQVKKSYNLSPDSLMEYNPEIRSKHIKQNINLPRGYEIKVPAIDIFTAQNETEVFKNYLEKPEE